MNHEKKVEEFIRTQYVRDPEKPPRLFVLRHAKSGGGLGPKVGEWPPNDDAAALAMEIVRTSENDVSAFDSRQSYALFVYGEDASEPRARCMYALTPKFVEDGETLEPTEGADSRGMTAQSMRHTEAIMRIALTAFDQTHRQNQHMLVQLQAQNERLLATNERLMAMGEQALQARIEAEEDKLAALAERVAGETEPEWKQIGMEMLKEHVAPKLLPKIAEATAMMFEPKPKKERRRKKRRRRISGGAEQKALPEPKKE